MSQIESIPGFNSDGFQVMLLPLKINSLGGAGIIRVNKILVENNTSNPNEYVFKLRDQYCDFYTVTDVVDNMNCNSFLNSLPGEFTPNEKLDYIIGKEFVIDSNPFEFKVSFEPISSVPRLGTFSCELIVEYTELNNGATGTYRLTINGTCANRLVDNIDGVGVTSDEYTLSVHSKPFNSFIKIE